MKTSILIIACLLSSCALIGQQDIQVSNFNYFSSFYNPASITRTKHLCGNVIGRNQWSGLNGRPNTGFINANYNFSNRFWGGVTLVNDVIGLQNSTLVKLGLGKKFPLSKNTSIAFGINLNYSHIKWGSNFITPDTPIGLDGAIPDHPISVGNFDSDVGLFIQSKNISIGLSTTHVTQPTLQQNSFSFQHKRHYYALCGYTHRMQIGNLENHLLAKSDVASTQIDVKSNFWHNSGWMVGLAYRVSDAIIPMVGYQKQVGRVHIIGIYSYDVTTSRLSNYSSGSHEICLKLCLAPPTFTERYTHPRHLGTWKQ